eukprot:scaffold304048_cov21-Tisochrysis_lutea.AAC.1
MLTWMPCVAELPHICDAHLGKVMCWQWLLDILCNDAHLLALLACMLCVARLHALRCSPACFAVLTCMHTAQLTWEGDVLAVATDPALLLRLLHTGVHACMYVGAQAVEPRMQRP